MGATAKQERKAEAMQLVSALGGPKSGAFAQQQASGFWPQQTSGTWMGATPYNANVVWQDTSSNATYCSASAALHPS